MERMEKQSSIKWLVKEANLLENNGWIASYIQQAEEMHEQEIIEARKDGIDAVFTKNEISNEQYYNETFKSE
jgi:hypothetical protein